MNILLDPNVAFVLLVIGFLMAILALFSPGTGILEIGALFALVLAGVSIFSLPTNPWALAILVLGVIPFLLALRYSRQYIYLVISMVALIVGSLFLFKPEEGLIAIDPILAVFVSVLSVGFMWLVGVKGLEAISRTPSHDLEKLSGMIGIAETEIEEEGTVYVNGESWTARSVQRIPQGYKVRVIQREGLVLQVEPVDQDQQE